MKSVKYIRQIETQSQRRIDRAVAIGEARQCPCGRMFHKRESVKKYCSSTCAELYK
jgi:hypothetical protein